ncbi:aspartyl protease family protein [Nodularia chucula]|uniref:aspartyl protease family protein n=1 Tax=Nodularia chucula TaxID=3093667 RepID=UPI0039C6C49C
MCNVEQFTFINADTTLGEAGFRPYMPITLVNQESSIPISALLDTGATVNVLPYTVGLDLEYVWERQTATLNLTGNLAQYEARVVVIQARIGKFEPVQLVFAWTKAVQVPLILGQVNFFMEFDVCFYRSQLYFAVSPKKKVSE